MQKLTQKQAVKIYFSVYGYGPKTYTSYKKELQREMNDILFADSLNEAAHTLELMGYGTECSYLEDAYYLRKEMGIKEDIPFCHTCRRNF